MVWQELKGRFPPVKRKRAKGEASSEQPEPGKDLSNYEIKRQKTMAENHQVLVELGLAGDTSNTADTDAAAAAADTDAAAAAAGVSGNKLTQCAFELPTYYDRFADKPAQGECMHPAPVLPLKGTSRVWRCSAKGRLEDLEKCIVIKNPHLQHICEGRKSAEVHTYPYYHQGPIGLVLAGSGGLMVGRAMLVRCRKAPIRDKSQWAADVAVHCLDPDIFPRKTQYYYWDLAEIEVWYQVVKVVKKGQVICTIEGTEILETHPLALYPDPHFMAAI